MEFKFRNLIYFHIFFIFSVKLKVRKCWKIAHLTEIPFTSCSSNKIFYATYHFLSFIWTFTFKCKLIITFQIGIYFNPFRCYLQERNLPKITIISFSQWWTKFTRNHFEIYFYSTLISLGPLDHFFSLWKLKTKWTFGHSVTHYIRL